MAPPSNETWNVQDKDAKKAIAEDTFDDCTSCRVTGTHFLLSSLQSIFLWLVSNVCVILRVCCIRWTGCLQLLYGHEQLAQTRTGNHARCNQIQDGFSKIGHCGYFGDSGGHGRFEGFKLRIWDRDMAFIVQYEYVIIIAMQDKHNMYYTTQENNKRTTSIPGITPISYPSLYMFNTYGNVTKETETRDSNSNR